MDLSKVPAPVFNTGIYLLRASQGGRKLMAAWLAERSANESTQVALNRMLRARHALQPATPSPGNPTCCWCLMAAWLWGA